MRKKKYKFTRSHRRNLSLAMTGRKMSRARRKAMSEYQLSRFKKPSELKKLSQRAKGIWKRKAYRKKITVARLAMWRKKSYRRKISKSRRAAWRRPSSRKRLLKGVTANRLLSVRQQEPSKACMKVYLALKKFVPNIELEYLISRMHVDIALPKKKLAIEVDGWAHTYFPEMKERDKKRDKYLISQGWKVLRIVLTKELGRKNPPISSLSFQVALDFLKGRL